MPYPPSPPTPAPQGGDSPPQPRPPQVQQFNRQAPQVQGNIANQAMPDSVARAMKARGADAFSAGIKNQRERLGDKYAALGLGAGAMGGAESRLAIAELSNRARVNQDVDIVQNDQNWKGSLQRYNAMLGENTAARQNYQTGLQGTALDQRQYEYDSNLDERQFQFGAGMAQDWNKFDASMTQRSGEFGANLGLNYNRLNEGQRQFDEGIGEQNRQFTDRMGLSYEQMGEQGRQFDTATSANLFSQQQQLDLGYDQLGEQSRQYDLNLPIQWDRNQQGWAGIDQGFGGLNEQARQFDTLQPLREQQALSQLAGIAGGFGPTGQSAPQPQNPLFNSNSLLNPNPAGIPNVIR